MSNLGNVRRLDGAIASKNSSVRTCFGRVLKHTLNNKGYYWVTLSSGNKKRCAYVHRLVAKAFLENPEEKPEVNHKDLDKTNNTTENLEWCTRKENVQHYVRSYS